MSTTNSQQIIQIPVKGAAAPVIDAVMCPHCHAEAVPARLGDKPKRPMILRSKEALKWFEKAVEQFLEQHQGRPMIEGPVRVELDIYRAINAGDVDNYLKGLLDALQESRILRNDRMVITVVATKHTDKVRPRYEVRIHELENVGTLFAEEPEEEDAP